MGQIKNSDVPDAVDDIHNYDSQHCKVRKNYAIFGDDRYIKMVDKNGMAFWVYDGPQSEHEGE